MHTFYIIVPALSLLNMGVNGAIIANTLSSRRDGNAAGSGPYSVRGTSRQIRQLHAADFHSDAVTETESSDSTSSGLVSPRQNPTGQTNSISANLLPAVLGSRGLQPMMRFMQRQDTGQDEVTSSADEVDTTASAQEVKRTVSMAGTLLSLPVGLLVDNGLPGGLVTKRVVGDVDEVTDIVSRLYSSRSTDSEPENILEVRNGSGGESCDEDTKVVRDLKLSSNATPSGAISRDIAVTSPPTAILSHGKAPSAVRRVLGVPVPGNVLPDVSSFPPLGGILSPRGVQNLGTLDGASIPDTTTPKVAGNASRRQDSDGTGTDTDVAALETVLDNVVPTEDVAEARRSMVLGHEKRGLLDSLLDPSAPTAKMVKRRVRRQDDGSVDANVTSDGAVKVDTTANSGADAEVDPTADTAADAGESTSADSVGDEASLNELD